ncbi:hypothetical protein DV735_g865, partial [Chaetothyriales sp. CBS 134920]
MSFVRPSARSLCQPVRLSRSLLQLTQRRHARVHDVRFVTTHQPSAAVLEKYRSKLEQKAKEEGLGSVSELKEAYKEKIEQVKKQAAAALPEKPNAAGEAASSASGTGIKPLSSYIDVSKVQALPVKEIEYIWRLRFASDPLSLCAVVPLSTYQRMQATARQHPHFILPLPRPDAEESSSGAQDEAAAAIAKPTTRTAADVHFLQWAFHPPASGTNSKSNTHTSTVIFTHLAAYKLHGPYAQPHTAITHHLDLADSHGIVLLNGSVVDGRGVSVEEGRWLLMCLQRFYDPQPQGGSEVGLNKRQALLEKFSKGDAGFSLEELVDEAERMG